MEEVLLPFLLKSCSASNPLEHQPGVQKVLDLVWVCMEVSYSSLILCTKSSYFTFGPRKQNYSKQTGLLSDETKYGNFALTTELHDKVNYPR